VAVKVTFDTVNKLIIAKAGITELDAKIDLYSDAKEDWQTNSDLNKLRFIFRAIGGDETAPGETAPLYAFIKYGWKIRPDEADHTLNITNGAILVEGNTAADPFEDTIGNYTVRIRMYVPVKATIVTSGSGVTQGDIDDITSGVWAEVSGSGDDYGTLLEDVERLTGNKITRSGDVITIFEDDGATPWKQYNVADGGRIEQ
jgi:hypothetical protein